MKKALILLAFFCFHLNSFAQEFERLRIGFPAYGSSNIAWVDYDNDGDLDFIITGASSGQYRADIYKNEGNDRFRLINTGIQGGASCSLAWGDYNNDGFPDLLISGYYYIDGDHYFVKLYRNDQQDQFSEVNFEFLSIANKETGAHFGDFDSDGKLDILLLGTMHAVGSQVVIYKNEGNDQFSLIQPDTIDYPSGAVDCGDYDNDGDLDILATGYSYPDTLTHIYRNDGNFVFNKIDANIMGGSSSSSCRFFDYNHDGKLDVVLFGSVSIPDTIWYLPGKNIRTIVVYKNEGNDQFKKIVLANRELRYGSIDCGDYNGDGNTGILMTGVYYRYIEISVGHYLMETWRYTLLYSYVGNDQFEYVTTGLPPMSDGNALWGDYDNDGDLDILMTGIEDNTGGRTVIYKNRFITLPSEGVNKIEVYPNPAKEYFYLVTTNLTNTKGLFRISTLNGKVVYSKTMELNNNTTNKVLLPDLHGMYIVEFVNESTHFASKILIGKSFREDYYW